MQLRTACRCSCAPHVGAGAQANSSTEQHAYPINALRNAAIREVRTTHFLVVDVDLWPASTLYDAVMRVPCAAHRSNPPPL